jgi:nicotinamide mononucleotide (NMN) deamidase PncC
VTSAAQQHLIDQIHTSGKQLVLALTGGGSGAIPALLEVAGASASVLQAIVPYAQSALETWLGGRVDHACSERTARAMAMAAFERARAISSADPRSLRGIGATASLVSNRPKRGPHRIHVAWQSAEATVAISCNLEKGARTRAEEERIATCLILDMVAEACDIAAAPLADPIVHAKLERREQHAPKQWTELLLGQRSALSIAEGDSPSLSEPLLFPGAFNPLHEGHRHMAEIAAAHCGMPVTFELSIANVDKPPLDFLELADRLGPLTAHPVLVTRAPTFVEKAQLAPGCTFVVGADTIERIAEPRYYHGAASERDAAIAAISAAGCRFLVFGRLHEGRFQTLASLPLPPALRSLCDEVDESAFRLDISSTQLRGAIAE